MRKTLLFQIVLLISTILLPLIHLWANTLYTDEDIKTIFLKEFQKRSPYSLEEISLERFRIEPSAYRVPKEAIYQIEWIGTPRAGSNTAIFSFTLRGGERQILRVWGFIEVRVPVVVAKNNLPNKAILNREDLLLEKRELSRLPQDVIINLDEAIGKELKISLQAGTVLRKGYIDEPLLIKRNQEVEIIAKGRNFVVKAKGVALQPGRLNEMIKVKNLSSQKTIQAKVIDENKVEVHF